MQIFKTNVALSLWEVKWCMPNVYEDEFAHFMFKHADTDFCSWTGNYYVCDIEIVSKVIGVWWYCAQKFPLDSIDSVDSIFTQTPKQF